MFVTFCLENEQRACARVGRQAPEITGTGHDSRDAAEPGVGSAVIVAADDRSGSFRNRSTDVTSVN
jgi:hypothetical protein